MKNTNPTSHYLTLVVRKDNLAKNRDAIVRTVAGMIEAAHFMQDPKNADAVAEAAAVTGHNKEVNKAALKAFLAIDFWAANGRRPAAEQDRRGRHADEEDRLDQARQGAGDLRQLRRPQRLERRQRDGEVTPIAAIAQQSVPSS